MTPKNRIKEGKNRIKGGSKMTQKIGHHLCTIPIAKTSFKIISSSDLFPNHESSKKLVL